VHGQVGLAHPPGERKGAGAAWWAAAVVIVAAGAALRFLAARGDLWLDEIWSLEQARVAGSIVGVFTRVHHDNNHHLNTLYLLAMGPATAPVVLRLASVVAGTLTVALAATSEARLDRYFALTWAFLLSVSYILVHYSSEARGYSLALLFAVAGYAAMERFLVTHHPAWAAGFAAAATLGILSHLTFLYALLAFECWAGVVALRSRRVRALRSGLVVTLGLPLAAFFLLWVVDLRHLTVGGGPEYRLTEVIRDLLRASFGIPRGAWEWLAIPVLGAAVLEVIRMARARDDRWVFFVVVILVGPCVVLLLTRPAYLAPRYFLVTVPFLLWLTAESVARLARSGRIGVAAAVALLAAFLVGNGLHIARLLREGRGHYGEALEFIARSEPGKVVTLGSDNDFRNGVVVGHFYPPFAGAPRLRYVRIGDWTDSAPSWVLVHHFDENPPPDAAVMGPTGRFYDLVRIFPYAGLSGWDWYLYRVRPMQAPR
jgi:hypothetical protein